MDKTKTTIITILVILIFGIPIYLGQSQEHILVIHSFGNDSDWVKQMNRGIETYLENNRETEFANRVVIDHYYLDMEQPARQKCEIYLTELRNTFKVIDDKKPEIIILSDDIAQRLVGIRLITPQPSNKNYLKRNAEWLAKNGGCSSNKTVKNNMVEEMLLPLNYQPQIIFMGVDNNVQEYGYDTASNVNGIFEHTNMTSVKETMQDLYRAIPESDEKPTNVIILIGKSAASQEIIKRMKGELTKNPFDVDIPLKWSGFKEASSWEDWKKSVLAANEKQAMIYIAGYGDIVGEQAEQQTEENLVKWTEACAKLPVVGSTNTYVTAGGMLAIMVSGQEQGNTAMYLAQQILDENQQSAKINFMEPRQFTVSMNEALLGSLSLPVIYESFSLESNNFIDSGSPYPSDCN